MRYRTFLLAVVFTITLLTNTFADPTLSVHKSYPCSPDNIWSGWQNIARPSFMLEYEHHWSQARVHVHDHDNNGYSKEFTISHNECWQWPEDIPTDHYVWTVNFYDDGNPSHPYWSGERHGPDFYIDRTAPSKPSFSEDHSGASPISSSNSWKPHNSPHFNMSSSDGNGSGINRFEMSRNGGSYSTVSSGHHPTLPDGRYNFKLRAIDNIGFVRNAPRTLYLNIDAHAPNHPSVFIQQCPSSDTPWPDWYNISQFHVKVYSGNDGNGSQTQTNKVSINGGEYSNLHTSHGIANWQPIFTSGTYTLDFISLDRIPHTSSAKRKYIRIDVDKPGLSISNPIDNALLNTNSAELRWAGNDQHSGIDHYEYSTDSISWTDVSTNTSVITNSLTDGEHLLFVKAVDVAGNDSICKTSFMTDTTSPELEIETPTNDMLINNDSITLIWSGRDATSGIDYYEYSTDSINWINCSTDTAAVFKNLTDGLHNMHVRATDNTNNETVKSVHFTTDITAPQINSSLLNSLVNADNNCSAILPDYTDSITVTDNISATVSLSQSPVPGTTISGETNALVIEATDDAGNISEISFNVVVNDVTDPVFTCSSDTTIVLPLGNVSYTITGIEFDPESIWDNCDYAVTNDLNNMESLLDATLPEGTTNVLWTVTDATGNSTSCTMAIDVTISTDITSTKEMNISIYPNPVSGVLNISSTNMIEYSVQIADITGQIRIAKTGLRSSIKLNVNELLPGIYLVKILTEDKTMIKKIIKR